VDFKDPDSGCALWVLVMIAFWLIVAAVILVAC
jgi:hypothetical protein